MLKIDSMGEVSEISVLDLMDGAIRERADVVFHELLENIRNVNTDPKKARTLTIKLTLTASGDRQDIEIDAQCEGRTAPIRNISTKVYLGEQDNTAVAVEHQRTMPGQLDLSGNEQPNAKMIKLADAKRA